MAPGSRSVKPPRRRTSEACSASPRSRSATSCSGATTGSTKRRLASEGVRIAAWKVNSIRQRMPRSLPWLDERRPDVVCLQETKLTDEAFTALLGDDLGERG